MQFNITHLVVCRHRHTADGEICGAGVYVHSVVTHETHFHDQIDFEGCPHGTLPAMQDDANTQADANLLVLRDRLIMLA